MTIMYLSGVTNDRDEAQLISDGVGLMVQPGNSYHLRVLRFPWWAADNGCFGNKWSEDVHFPWLDRLPRDRCLFAVSPDVYPDAAESLALGLRYASLIRDLGFPVAIVAQDGAERMHWPWDELDALFLGGERRPRPADEWKVSDAAAALTARARAAGKWVHMGRVNGRARVRRAAEMGCLSVDGTALKYRRQKRASDRPGDREARGAHELGGWQAAVRLAPPLPFTPEAPAHATHRAAMAHLGAAS